MPGAGLHNRVRHAAALWARMRCGACALVLSGGPGKREGGRSEAGAMLELLRCQDTPAPAPHLVLLEEGSTNTAENARNALQARQCMLWPCPHAPLAAQMLTPLLGRLRELHVVTSDWHAARARVPFEVFTPPSVRLFVHGAPALASDAEAGRSTLSDLQLLPSTLADLQRLLPAATPPSPAFLLWRCALRSLATDPPPPSVTVVAFAANAPPPPGAARDLLAGLSLLGPCGRLQSTSQPVVVVSLEARPAACVAPSIWFVAATEQDGGAHVSTLAPLGDGLWAVRVDCRQQPMHSGQPIDLAEHLGCERQQQEENHASSSPSSS